MARTKTFAEKVIKGGAVYGEVCPKCEQEVQFLKRVEPVIKENGAIGFNDVIVSYCKCNHQDVHEK